MAHKVINLEILGDGTNTVARARYWGKGIDPIEGAGSAHRDRSDKPDAETGELLATAQALEVLAARLRRRANGRIKHADEIKRHKAEIAARAVAAWQRNPLAPGTGGKGAVPWPLPTYVAIDTEHDSETPWAMQDKIAKMVDEKRFHQ